MTDLEGEGFEPSTSSGIIPVLEFITAKQFSFPSIITSTNSANLPYPTFTHVGIAANGQPYLIFPFVTTVNDCGSFVFPNVVTIAVSFHSVMIGHCTGVLESSGVDPEDDVTIATTSPYPCDLDSSCFNLQRG